MSLETDLDALSFVSTNLSLGFTFPGLEKGFPIGAIVDSGGSLPFLRDHEVIYSRI